MGPGMVPGNIWAINWCPDTFVHQNGARKLMENRSFPSDIGHWEGAWAHIGTGMMSGHIYTPEGCLGTCGNRMGAGAHSHRKIVQAHIGTNGARAHMGTTRVLGIYGHRNGAWEHMGTGKVPGHI